MVWKLDRLARSVHQLVETASELQARGIGLKVLTQQIDTTTPGGRLVFHMFAAVAEFERELTLERTHAGLATARALGRRGGRKPTLGPAEVKRAKAMLTDPAITAEEVARQLGVPVSTLYRHLPGGRSADVVGACGGCLQADFAKFAEGWKPAAGLWRERQ